jgi:nucleotide-binding universal stress UspA family protein
MFNENENRAPTTLRRHIDRILCPTDLSAEADEALAYGIALAHAYEAKFFICHCVTQTQPNWHDQIKGIAHIRELFTTSLNPYLKPFSQSTLDWEGIVVEGKVEETIAAQATANAIDLIVMRSRRRPYAAALLGSTAEALCRITPCPVLITHPNEHEWVDRVNGTLNLQRILVAYDFSPYSEIALTYAISLAQEFQATLYLLHVLPVISEYNNIPPEENIFFQVMRRLEEAIPAETHLWCKVEAEIRTGQPYYEILNYAEGNKIDLICMGTHGSDKGKWSFFGSNTDRVLRQSPCPVLIARPTTHRPVESSVQGEEGVAK